MKLSNTNFPFNITQFVFEQSAGFRNAMGHAAVNFWNAQDQILDAMQEYANGWFERRHTGAQDALDTAQQMIDAATPIESIRECQKWALGSFERIIDDGLACQKHLMSISALMAPPLSPSDERAEAKPAATEHRRSSQSRVAA